MPKPTPDRKAQFAAALRLAGMTQARWAEQRGLSQAHVSLVLNGHRESLRLLAEMDRFIAEHLQPVAA
jgi:predicted transcriptional regulator